MQSQATVPVKKIIKPIVLLARLPFHIVGILPFILGTVLGYRVNGDFNVPIFLWGLTAVILIMLTTYLNGECYDIKEDRLSAKMGRNVFTGGSQVIANNIIAPYYVKIASFTAISFAAFIGLLLQFHYKTGVYTIPLGATGAIAGFFYSLPPVRLVKRGFGEILIGYCYGWLPIAAGCYLQAAKIVPLVHWIAVPVAVTIFNVILINEFPDYPADSIVGKTNMLVRLGKRKAAYIYACSAAILWAALIVSIQKWLSPIVAVMCFSICIGSIILAAMMLAGYYNKSKPLLFMCGFTIVVNVATTSIYIVAVLLMKG